MNVPKRIYKPGTRQGVLALPKSAQNVSGQTNDESPQPFPIPCLPQAAAKMARAIAQTERTPETLAGCCVLGFLSASIGAGLQIKSGANRITRANFYLLLSAESGSGKSETIRHAAKPFVEYASELLDDWRKHTLPKAEAERDMFDAEIAGLQKQAAGKTIGAVERETIRAASK